MTNNLTYRTILAAKLGNPEAIRDILAHYKTQINRMSRRTYYDDLDHPHQVSVPEVADEIREALIFGIIFDFDPSKLPEGETLEP